MDQPGRDAALSPGVRRSTVSGFRQRLAVHLNVEVSSEHCRPGWPEQPDRVASRPVDDVFLFV